MVSLEFLVTAQILSDCSNRKCKPVAPIVEVWTSGPTTWVMAISRVAKTFLLAFYAFTRAKRCHGIQKQFSEPLVWIYELVASTLLPSPAVRQ